MLPCLFHLRFLGEPAQAGHRELPHSFLYKTHTHTVNSCLVLWLHVHLFTQVTPAAGQKATSWSILLAPPPPAHPESQAESPPRPTESRWVPQSTDTRGQEHGRASRKGLLQASSCEKAKIGLLLVTPKAVLQTSSRAWNQGLFAAGP